MFRNNIDTSQESFSTFLGTNGLDIKCLQDMYLDGSLSSASLSPSTSSPPNTPLTTMPTKLGAPLNMTSLQQQHNDHNMNSTILGVALNAAAAAGGANSLHNALLLQHRQRQLLLQQQQQQQYHQQQLTVAAVAQHQLALAAAANNNQQQDEISKSLKMFAMLNACKADQNNLQALPVDAIMQDFACNGFISDEFNRYQYHTAYMQYAANQNIHAQQYQQQQQQLQFQQQQQQQLLNMGYAEKKRNNLWQRTHTHAATTTAGAAAVTTAVATSSVGTDHNGNHNSNNSTVKNTKAQKRYNGTNKVSSKHCVFCENNNEPEAVVKSHSVRDSLGRVLCPKLRTYVCPICKASGDLAHTVKYCPQKPIITMEDAIKAESFRLAKSAYYKQQMKV